ncbi:hypothetical protein GGF32_002410 [Allomyces javanicus]|nr:hypothetical protein GGF32_002410 [Allomyces javanicus]
MSSSITMPTNDAPISGMYIVKRDGHKEVISFDKITKRIKSLCNGLNMSFIDPLRIVKSVIEGLYSGAKTTMLDTLAAEVCASLSHVHHDYNTLAARIEVSNLHKQTSDSFVETVRKLYNCSRGDEHCPMVTKEFIDDVEFHGDKLDKVINYERDYAFGYFAIKTLMKSYLLKFDGQVIERPQHMLMRVAVALHGRDFDAVVETYEAMSLKKFIHASPTLFNAGCPRNGLASCFLLSTQDSIEGIFDTVKECAMVSALSGGIGLNIHDVRSKGSLIKSTGGTSEGIIPLLKVLNDTALFVTQSSKRPGAIAVYLETTHPEILDFLDMKRISGKEELRARDLFYAVWVSDLFMEKVEKNEEWCLFCPGEAPGLSSVYGQEYRELYAKYEAEGKYRKKIQARAIWDSIIKSQIESGTPYVVSKDAVNMKNNQSHVGTIKNSNLCVAPETKILTKNGHQTISELEGQEVEVWNGEEWSKTTVHKTNGAAELMKVEFSNGAVLECTPYHKFAIHGKNGVVEKEAKGLQIDDTLIQVKFPVIHGGAANMASKNAVPLECNLEKRLQWLEDVIDATSSTLQVTSTEKDFLNNVRLMLQTMGIDTSVRQTDHASFRIVLDEHHIDQLSKLGFRPLQHWDCATAPSFRDEHFVKVTNIECTGRVDATYCFNESLKHRGIFNGVVTLQCSEITLYCDEKETAVCILASACLPTFVKVDANGSKFFDHEDLGRNVRIITRNLNKVIDKTKYPNEKTRRSNMRHRPIAIGVSGLQDMFLKLKLDFDSAEARKLNSDIAETIYFAAVSESCELAKKVGSYETFVGSEFSKGNLQFDLARLRDGRVAQFSGRYDWDALRKDIVEHGMRNCLLTGYMPTASTSTILGVSECIEPLHGVIYLRRTMSGEFQQVNKYLMEDLLEAGLWNETIKNLIIQNRGSVQEINAIPSDIKKRYRTVWQIPQKALIEMAADRQMFTDQTQSMNLFKAQPTYSALSSMLMYGWKQGLKTLVYYLRSQPRAAALQFNQSKIVQKPNEVEAEPDASGPVCRMDAGCVSCSG